MNRCFIQQHFREEHCEAGHLQIDTVLRPPLCRKASNFLSLDTVHGAVPQRRALRTEGFSGWFPNPDEKRVNPPEGQEAMAIQEAEQEEEHEEDPLSEALQNAGDAVSADAEKSLEKIKADAANSLEASKDDGAGKAAVEAAKEQEDTGDPPDVDDELPGPFYTRAWFLGLVLMAFVGVTSYTVWQVSRLASDPKGSEEDEVERTYAHDPRAPVPTDGKGAKGKGTGAQAHFVHKAMILRMLTAALSKEAEAVKSVIFKSIGLLQSEHRLVLPICGHRLAQTAADKKKFQLQIVQQIQQLAVQQQQQQAMHQWLLQQVLAQQQEQKALLQQRAVPASPTEGESIESMPATKGSKTLSTAPCTPCAQWPQVQIPPPSGRHPAVQQNNLLQLPPLLHSLPIRTSGNRTSPVKTQEKGRPPMEPPSEEAEDEAASEEKREEAERSETTVAPEACPEVQAEASDASPEAKADLEPQSTPTQEESKVPEHQESSTKNAEEKSSAATIAEAECVTEAPKEGKKECETHDPLEAPTGPGRPRHAGEEPHTSYNSYKHKQVRRRPQRSACAETAQWQPVRRGKAGPRHSEPCEPEESPEPEQKEQKGWQQAQPAQPAQPARQAQPAQQEQPEQQAQQAQSWKRPGKMSMRSSGAKSKNGSSTAPSTGLRWRPTVPHSDR
ncbi:unnamed protein product [Symbiodinium natans]|uniref:Uncharacterized protein n=1 Tax=Symbiodinium natans TaxID=878477 RepID=A0A812I7U6_9DINO|nr:unnamed protein product [Symbiodinium natans]